VVCGCDAKGALLDLVAIRFRPGSRRCQELQAGGNIIDMLLHVSRDAVSGLVGK